ncbi:FtsB family cell division protein [Anaerorhabdus furcosa]|uniref:Septum formation initiator n=1 Tax=Anaerorhabdus furcosa TaxID=118967 RepID=A0A1T4KRP3_9FIRM|nr:septum formation initiator family protein [Anaerorhabdus furcosa]SJZ45008.1 Septum formation initiator [Anaerorhabdus furcosa]
MTQQTVRRKVVKRKKPKRTLRPLTKLLCIAVILFSGWLIYGVVEEIGTTIALQKQLKEVKVKLETVKDENEYLVSQRDKLADPNYVQSYARGNYMMTKDGEKIYYLPSKDK